MIPTEEETEKMLDMEEHTKIRIRKDPNNANYVTERVTVNGYTIQIPVGEEVSVPLTVRDILLRKGVL